jgi:hypothetical protein
MTIYAGLGVSQAIFYFFMGAMFAILTYYTSQRLHKVSLNGKFTNVTLVHGQFVIQSRPQSNA